jgi:hypothetical protein
VHDHQATRGPIGQRLLRDQLSRQMEFEVGGLLSSHEAKLFDLYFPFSWLEGRAPMNGIKNCQSNLLDA